MKNSSNSNAPSSRTSIHTINREIHKQDLQNLGEPEETLGGRLARVVKVFGTIRPLLLVLSTFPILPPASRTAVTVLVQSLDALSVVAMPGDGEEAADFKAGRDL